MHDHRPAASHDGDDADLPIVAIVGRPNVGKSTFLARASGRFVETSNAPGSTVLTERRRIAAGGGAWLVDLPGTRSLVDQPTGEEPFWRMLLATRPDAILVLADAGDVRRHLPLAIACRDLGLPIVLAANLADEADRRGIGLDVGRLGQLLLAPVHLTNGRRGTGIDAAVADVVRLAGLRKATREGRRAPRSTIPAAIFPPCDELAIGAEVERLAGWRSLGAAVHDTSGLAAAVETGLLAPRGAATITLAGRLEPLRWQIAAGWADQVERRRDVRPPRRDTLRRMATSPWPGIPLFIAITIAMFGTMVVLGGWLSALLTSAWNASVSPWLTTVVNGLAPDSPIARAFLWAFDGGLLAMLAVGIPYILTFYILLAILEDSGYLTSAAVLGDRIFNRLGLPGRTAIPLLAAAGCNVPAIYGTRILGRRRERLLGAFLVTLTPCSARSAVVVAALAPFVGLPATIAAFGVTVGLILAAGLAANALVPGRQPALILELAPLRAPVPGHVARKAWNRFRGFVMTATPIMLAGSFVLGLAWEAGFWAPLAGVLEPLTQAILGLPAIAGIAIIFGFLRKELALQLLMALAVITYGSGAIRLDEVLSPSQLFVFAVATAISVPCAATLATLVSELGGRAATVITGATLALALGAGGVLARILGIA